MAHYDPLFARYYDLLVHGRHEALATEEEIAFLMSAFAKRQGGVQDVLDVGCGAGRYLVPVAAQGYSVTGIDNCPGMLSQCSDRLELRGLSARLVELDLMQLREAAQYDYVLCMNSVISYLLDTQSIIRALVSFGGALRPGGLLVLETWNVLANTGSLNSTDIQGMVDGQTRIVCRTTRRYDSFASIHRSILDVTVEDPDGDHAFTQEEVLRVMTVGETTAYLERAGFVSISAHLRQDSYEPESGDESIVFLATRPG